MIALIEGFELGYGLTDKGYNANRLILTIENSHAVLVIPSKKHRKVLRECDRQLYKKRNVVERILQKFRAS